MKVDGTSKSGKTQKSKKSGDAKKTGDSSFGNMIGGADKNQGASGTDGASSLSPAMALGALLTAQEAGDATSEEAKARARKRADEIFDCLEKIQMGLLVGGIKAGDLKDLAEVIAEHKMQDLDPDLAWIMDEIDLRAQVELAKFDRA